MKFLLNLLLFACFTTISIAAKKPAADSVVISVTSIADMQAYAGQSKSVIVKDIYKGGIFNKLPKGAIVPDDIVTYSSAQADSVWYRHYDKYNGIMPQWYTAMPTDSTVSASAALNYVFSKYNTGLIRFSPNAVYLIDSAVNIVNASNLIINGNGVKIKETYNNKGTFYFTAPQKVTIKDFIFLGSETYASFMINSPTQTRAFIYMVNGSNCSIQNITSSAKRTAIYLGKTTYSSIDGFLHIGFLDDTHKANANFCPTVSVINDNLVNPVSSENGYIKVRNGHAINTGSAITMGDVSKHFSISDITGYNLFDNCIYISSGMYGSVSNCHFKKAHQGIKVRGRGIIVTGNSIVNTVIGIIATGNGDASSTDPYDGGPFPDEAGGNGFALVVSNNIIDSVSQRGIQIAEQDGLGTHGVRCYSNTVSHHTAPTDYAFYFIGISNFDVENNTVFRSAANVAVLMSNGTNDSLRHSSFINNHFKLCAGSGVRFSKVMFSNISNNDADGVTGTFLDFRTCNNNTIAFNRNSGGLVVQAGATYNNKSNLAIFNTGPTMSIDAINNFSLFNSTTFTLPVKYGGTGTNLVTAASLDFLPTAAGTSSELTITVAGAADGDIVNLGVPNAASNANSCYTARVSAANTVKIQFNNYSAVLIDPAVGTFKVLVFK
jgi:hypothetical protein